MNDLQYEHAQLHIALLGQRPAYQYTAKNYAIKDPKLNIENGYLKKEEIVKTLSVLNDRGFTAWLSINTKEKDCIEGVSALDDFWLDIDARPKGIDNRIATTEEMKEALERAQKIKDCVENNFAAIGFLANSGNGFHIHFPLPHFPLEPEVRKTVNDKVREFAKHAASLVNATIDNTYDISRKTTLIGTLNKKIPDKPLQTLWDKSYFNEGLAAALRLVDTARNQNKQLLEEIIKTELPKTKKQIAVLATDKHVDLEELLRINQKLYDLLKLGDYKKYGYKSRSEAEEAVLVILAMEGFNDQEMTAIMDNCAIGKWQEKTDSYKTLSIEHAREQAAKYIQKKQENKEQPEKEEINPVLIAKDIMDRYSFILDDLSDVLYYYNEKEGIYNSNTKRLLNREIAKILDDDTRVRYYADVENWIKSTANIRSVDENPELLAIKNGILNLRTRELKPFTSDLFITKKLKWEYNKDAKCPEIDKFKLRILPEENKRLLAQENEGYCLYGDLIFKKAYLANGKTDTGKTVHQNIVAAFLGEENLSHQTIQALNHIRFSPANLYGKMGNFVDDLPSSIVKTTGFFKMALGHGVIPAERKGKDAFNFQNKAKFWINANDLPPVAKWEDTDAYFNRLLINDYEIQIPMGEQDPNLVYKLTTPEEMSGFLNQALDGLDRLLKNQKFTYGKTQDETRQIYTRRSDPAKWFVETCLQITNNYDDWVYHEDVFRECVTVCQAEQIKKIPSSGELTKAIQANCIGAKLTRIRKVVAYNPKTQKDLVKFEPSWRFVRIVRFVQGFDNSRGKNENEVVKKKNPKSLDDFEKDAQNAQNAQTQQGEGLGTPATPTTKQITPEVEKAIDKVAERMAEGVKQAAEHRSSCDFYDNRFCYNECKNYNGENCPFRNKLTKESLLPKRCYGYEAPNPGGDS